MEGSLRGVVRKLNTQGCCFLCLEPNTIKLEINGEVDETVSELIRKETSMRCLTRYLKVNLDVMEQATFSEGISKTGSKPEVNVKVDLCESCEKLTSGFSSLFQKLEKIRLEMNYFLEKIQKCISQSTKAPELVHNYSQRMTSDLVVSSELAFVNNLRKEVSKKCLKELNSPRLHVILTRENYKGIKRENTDTSSESEEADIQSNVNSTGEISLSDFTSSPPPSPILTQDNEEVKFSESLALTENDKLSPKPSVKRKTKKGKYYTKNPSTGMFECNKCDKKSKCSKTITYHFKSVHLKLRYKCDVCGSTFTDPSSLNLHKRTCAQKLVLELAKEIDPKLKFICKVCGKRFAKYKKLKDHTRWVHTNTNRYQCDLCDKKYTTPSNLKSHQESFHQSRKLSCNGCNKTYKNLGRYRQHVKNCGNKITPETV